ncbi:hypothetical protein GQ42DRAFT_88906 [Ramicandelaber brevisporus]|nr:hypothetical protein GQ42DRAFT_88906 [Ramicandelaber brevisporus]
MGNEMWVLKNWRWRWLFGVQGRLLGGVGRSVLYITRNGTWVARRQCLSPPCGALIDRAVRISLGRMLRAVAGLRHPLRSPHVLARRALSLDTAAAVNLVDKCGRAINGRHGVCVGRMVRPPANQRLCMGCNSCVRSWHRQPVSSHRRHLSGS